MAERYPDVEALIRKAAADPTLREKARQRFAEMITKGNLLGGIGDRSQQVFPSDYGSCALSLWAQKHGLEDLPRNPIDDVLMRLDLGSMMGAWLGCLLEAGANTTGTGWWVFLEYEPGIGHIDALACETESSSGSADPVKLGGIRVPIEFKSSYDTGTIKEPEETNMAHLAQLTDYSLQMDARDMLLVYAKPPGKAGQRFKVFLREVEPYIELVEKEQFRLLPALLDEPPQADPQAPWACYTCRYSACEMNKNKAKNALDVLFT